MPIAFEHLTRPTPGAAGRLRGLDRLRLAPPLAHLVWRVLDAGPAEHTNRVPLPEYRANLEAFVTRVQGVGAVPVLLTRPYHGTSDDPETWLTYIPAYNDATRQVAAARRADSWTSRPTHAMPASSSPTTPISTFGAASAWPGCS